MYHTYTTIDIWEWTLCSRVTLCFQEHTQRKNLEWGGLYSIQQQFCSINTVQSILWEFNVVPLFDCQQFKLHLFIFPAVARLFHSFAWCAVGLTGSWDWTAFVEVIIQNPVKRRFIMTFWVDPMEIMLSRVVATSSGRFLKLHINIFIAPSGKKKFAKHHNAERRQHQCVHEIVLSW